MGKKYFVFMMMVLVLSVAQGQTIESKKCKTCGKPLKECRYKGKHPQRETTQQATQNNRPSSTTTSQQKKVRMEGDDIVCIVDGTEYCYRMVYVGGGTYTMGCTSEQGSDCYGDEKPAHSVTVSGFYMGQTEVTQALWKAVMGSEPTYNGGWTSEYGKGNNYPAYRVSYEDIKTFISKLNSLTGKTFRLPTEEEWEYAARGGNSSRGYKYSGSDNIGSVAWYDGNSGSKTHPVAQKQANELGLYDMSGNVWEWCSSLWCSDYNSARRALAESTAVAAGTTAPGTAACRTVTAAARRSAATTSGFGWPDSSPKKLS